MEEALDRALRISRAHAREDDDVALVFAQLGERRLRAGLARAARSAARRAGRPAALPAEGPRDLTAARACRSACDRLRRLFADVPGGLDSFLDDGPVSPSGFAMLASRHPRDVGGIADGLRPSTRFETRSEQAAFRVLVDRLRGYFLTQQGEPRKSSFAGTGFTADDCVSDGVVEAPPRSCRGPGAGGRRSRSRRSGAI